MSAICTLCPHECRLSEGQWGACRARMNDAGRVVAGNYGQITSIALDPIEKKPLLRFHPGSMILSIGGYGCNLRCPFCQNHEISMAARKDIRVQHVPPESLAEMAESLIPRGNIGVAYTYNEPLVGFEYVRDCARAVRAKNLLNVLVTNGCFREDWLKEILLWIDAMNIDLKGFTDAYYRWVGGDLETVKRAIILCASSCHVELTTLIVPGKNDDPDEMRRMCQWIASVDPEIPLHITRFFPRYRATAFTPTPKETLFRLADIAREYLRHVYTGNI